MLCPMYLSWTGCCFKRGSLKLTVPSCCLSYCTELFMALARKNPELMQHLRLSRSQEGHFPAHIFCSMSYVTWLIPPCVFIHGQCNYSTSAVKLSWAGYEGKLGKGGKTLALKWVFCGVLFVESELSWALLLCGCHGEKHRLLCNKIIQEKTFPRIF